ncbi:MAG TPA: glycine zipper domain-containing protein, partial [Verrucomicrobiae bacterium]|nr:glycine zipper domain-containing protein [Verrucomicrobiae bacterium]
KGERSMKAKLVMSAGIVVSGVLLLLLAGCTTPTGEPSYTGTGALVGGVSGAGLGSLVARRNPAAGAVLGGAAGLITGGLIGSAMDQESRPPVYVAAPPPPPIAEPVPPAPAPGYLWLRGQWVWNGSAWTWAAGHWVPGASPQPVWVQPQWIRGPYGWYWQPGHWQ